MKTCLCILSLSVAWPVLTGKCPKIDIANGGYHQHMKGRKIVFRCHSNYFLYGDDTVFCIGRRWSHLPPVCLASGCADVKPPVNGNLSTLLNGTVVNFSCFSGYTSFGHTTILCNGENWDWLPPTCVANRDVTVCDFEKKNMCGWQQDDSDDFDWVFNSGSTRTSFTGPSWDHTFEKERRKGHYMYIETSGTEKEGDRATLISPTYDADQSNTYFSFWYHMYGPKAGSVGDLVVSVGLADDLEVLFSETGNHGNTWNEGKIFIREMKTQFQVVISASKGKGWQGDIAIDDVRLGNCSDGLIWTAVSDTVSTTIASIQPVSADLTVEYDVSRETATTSLTSSLNPILQTTQQQEPNVTSASKIAREFTSAANIDKRYSATKQSNPTTDSLGNTNSDQFPNIGQLSSYRTLSVLPLGIYLGVLIPIALIAIVLVIVAVCFRRRRLVGSLSV